jgi:16S rRNA (guanine(966)-N(2))-methyltransferase RsmD
MLEARGRIAGARVLDLYAGTGALALDALSRGAERATLVETGRDALAAIRANVASLGLDARARVVALSVERAAGALRADAPFDLVFADPPYADVADAARAIAALAAAALFAENTEIVLEHAHKDGAPDIAGLTLEGTRRYGDTSISFYSRP